MNGMDLIRDALDPRRSVVVEACAGSGKTWLLVSRILRLLLDGVAPGEILAITYTRKAAREIEERLMDWLRLLAVGDEAQVRAFLQQRALPAEEAEAALVRARGLYERVLTAQPPLAVSTFHGWYARLVQGAPLSSDLAGFVLHEAGMRLKDEVWQLFAAERARSNDAATASLLWLLQNTGLETARKLLFGLSDRRAEWHAFAGEGDGAAARALAGLREALEVAEAPAAIDALLGDELFMRKLRDYAGILRRSDLDRDLQAAQVLEEAFACGGDDRFGPISAALLTKDGSLRQRKPGKEADRRFGADAGRLLQLHAWLGERVLATQAARREELAYELNAHVFTAGAAWIEALDRYKRERRLMDFADLEWHVWRMLADETHAAFLQARLDARYRHILLDEFQDTNPLQWQILLAWLAAYGTLDADRPRVFVVGDPKQSIYRFRRAEPRVFDCAAAFLREGYAVCMLANDATWRNAPTLVEVVNRVFADAPQFPHFRPHRSLNAGLPGRVELLPLCVRAAAEATTTTLRDPLAEPQAVAEDGRRRDEAALLASRIRDIVGRWAVVDSGDGRERPARYGDIMVLTRRRGVLPEFERALRAAGIPYLSTGRGGLLRTLEAADLTALLRCLVTTADDLSLAHALRMPALAASDEDLIMLAGRGEPDWWQRLQASAAEGAASAALRRAAGLLAGWRAAAARLPVHDLLDRIYHEGDLLARYRRAVPDTLWPGVAANLEAYIALALQLDAGRYPSLPRFLDELARLDEAGDQEAPDEGTIQATEAGDRVRLLTIHGAKGLEAPIVWLIDAHNTYQPPEAWSLLLDWPPEAARPSHLSVLGRKEERGGRRGALIEAEAAYAEREELNLLYVALTRARQFFFASGIAAERASGKTSYWERIAKALADLGAEAGTFGEAPAQAEESAAAAPLPAPPARWPAIPPTGRRREAATAGMSHGTRLHAALDWLSAGGDAARPPQGIPPADWPAFRAAARAILEAPRLQAFFDPARYLRARNEAEFVLADGSVGRIDRLVETAGAVWVLDYKSGRPEADLLEAYRAQMAAYRAAVGTLFPGRPVRCGLVFGEGGFEEILA
ncbi:MAG: UvrD-helicase domain-containing protein [Burkholderiales bacterium]|nr:ATP-dependent helicase/nuclease subunit A [Rhodocyclaceae bacterium]MCQ3924289.1 ATP-dependent exodnase subunit beta [Rhodocyclaceae bacterium]MCZ2418407.1 UvrD-helicase domain-containing protein [Burkholderiales bacterium]HNQ58109.1 UvrD-helicase domain-containing protein [Candidatus Desulfobacillus denitrificans]HNT61795.1 UvrD-helicase domain-containing protein [Candidatus Desulfobacillus denitrificans]